MILQTLGHASLLLKSTQGEPHIITDPWITGSTYWRSWWLQNYPNKTQLNSITDIPYAYITHEHPDHFHTPSLRKFGKDTKFLFPNLPQKGFFNYMSENKYSFEIIPIMKWIKLNQKIQILSIPLWNDDSILLIDTKDALIVNLNDSKPSKALQKWILRIVKKIDKYTVLLSSYSPASIVNSFRKNGQELSIKTKKDYVVYLNSVCNIIKPDAFIPFASQVIFQRDDSKWANEHKVGFADLEMYWNTNTKLLRPYSTLNLLTKKTSFVDEKNYNPPSKNSIILAKNKEKEERNRKLSEKEINKLEKKLNKLRYIYRFLFPRGLGLRLDSEMYTLDWRSKKIVNKKINTELDFIIEVPTGALQDAINFDHIGDLGITMFTLFHMSETTRLNPKRIYLFLILITLDDYNHTESFKTFINWIGTILFTRIKLFFKPIPSRI